MNSPTRSALRRRQFVAALGSAVAAPSIVRAQAAKPGVALVIGNSRYKWEAALPNVRRDAADVARAFKALGLATELVEDADRSAMMRAIDNFANAARGASFAAFYFAGHGAQWNANPYFVPIDADLSEPTTDRLVATNSARNAARSAKYKLLVYDNCRNNPADGWRQKQAEDRAISRPRDVANTNNANPKTVILWSAQPGRVALDGPAGRNSPFATALIRQLSGESIDLSSLGRKTRRDVLIQTRGRQLTTHFYSVDKGALISGSRLSVEPISSVDSAGLVELGSAYSFAKTAKTPLAEGLVAFRPLGTTAHQHLDRCRLRCSNFSVVLASQLPLQLDRATCSQLPLVQDP